MDPRRKNLEGKSLQIMTPMYGGMAAMNYIQSLLQLVIMLRELDIPFNYAFIKNESLISRARNRTVDETLKNTDYTHTIFIDADIGFDPRDILGMMELDLPIVGAPCSKKNIRWDRVVNAIRKNPNFAWTPEVLDSMCGDFVINFIPDPSGRVTFKTNQPMEVSQLGTGCLMIKREVFERFREHYHDEWYESPQDPAALPGPIHDFFRCGINKETRQYDSEDYWFCSMCRAMGEKIWVLPWMKTTHQGAYEFKGNLPAVGEFVGTF